MPVPRRIKTIRLAARIRKDYSLQGILSYLPPMQKLKFLRNSAQSGLKPPILASSNTTNLNPTTAQKPVVRARAVMRKAR